MPYREIAFGYGIANWEQNEVNDITGKADKNGMTMHVHTMGDAAVHRAVEAFVAKGGVAEYGNFCMFAYQKLHIKVLR